MLNFPDAPTTGQEFVTPKATFIWTLGPDRWRRTVPIIDPMVTFLEPNHVLINTAIPISVWGQGFKPDAMVYLNGGVTLPVTFVSSNELRVTMPSKAAPEVEKVWVYHPGDPTYLPPVDGLDFTYDAVPLVLTSLNPSSSIQQPGVNISVTLNGSGFVQNDSWVWWNGLMSATTYISPTQLRTDSVRLTDVGTFPVYVKSQSSANQSNTLEFYVTSNQPPQLLSVSPNTTQQGNTIPVLTVTGQNFVNGNRIVLDGWVKPTTFVNSTTLTTPNVYAKFGYPKIKVTVENTPGEVSVNCTALPGATPTGRVIPEVWPHTHNSNPYYGRNFLEYTGGYSDADEVWITDAYLETPNWILHNSWPEGGMLMFQCSWLGNPEWSRKIYADVMLKKNGVQSGTTARMIIGGT